MKAARVCIGVALVLALGGCTSSVHEGWGEAYRTNLERMVEDPNAVLLTPDGPSGLDGATTEKVVEKYQKKQGETRQPGRVPSMIQITTGDTR